jgi:alanyl-tRNA synthetase
LADGLIDGALDTGGGFLVVARVDAANPDVLRDIADKVRNKLKPSLVVLAANVDGRPAFLAAATPDLVGRGVHAGNIIGAVARIAGGGGGGRPDMAQAGAKEASRIDAALAEARRLGLEALKG